MCYNTLNADFDFLYYNTILYYTEKAMTWGTFGTVHIISLAISALIITALYFILKKCSEKVQTAVLGVLSFSGVSAIIFNLLAWNSPLEYLPFHLCSLTAMVLPFAVFTKSKILNNLLLLWGLGAFLALVINNAQASYEIFSFTFAFYYFPHTFEFGIIVLNFALGRVKRDVRCIIPTVAITFAVYTAVHFINVAVNTYCIRNNVLDWAGNVVSVNYMFSLVPENPVLQLLYTKPYWYMFSAIPIIVVYLCVVYYKEIFLIFKNRKQLVK